QYRDVRVLTVYGGQGYERQLQQLRTGVDIVVGTPGRVLDLINRNALDLSGVGSVVLDEADEMLSMGFIEDIEAILTATPAERQTTLFSATLPSAIRRLAARYLQEPQAVTIGQTQRTVAATEQRYYLVNQADKFAALTRVFEMEEIASALVFARTRMGTAELADDLSLHGFPAEALSGDLSQPAREQVLDRFRRHRVKILVATDVAARGLDIDGISHVVNYDLPQDADAYVHRIGRTGRAGKTGVAISLITPKERWRLGRIEAYTKQKITPVTLPTEADIYARRAEVLLERVRVWLRRDRFRQERGMVEALVGEGYDAMDIAAAALKLARTEERNRPIAPVSELQYGRAKDRKRDRPQRDERPPRQRSHASHEKGMVRLTLSGGKMQGIRANDIVASIAQQADIPGHSIGAIRIQDQHTLMDVPEQLVAKVLAKSGPYQIRQRAVTISAPVVSQP
ncbi:MAG: DEAD/DEAH box helicase, partial [Candidatus Tectomicrobia bacterium]|nr:DEAD/DEAH box helicase [Candidatus Tectomicrobia bacterium]